MKPISHLKIFKISVLVILTLLLNVSCKSTDILFQENNKDWTKTGDADWSFSNKELIGKVNDGTGYLISTQRYNDFILEVDFKPDSTINSGVFVRCKNENVSARSCYEINIWDLNPNQDYRTGAIVLKTNPLAKVETIDKWNTYKIKNEGERIQVWVNDILTTDIKDKGLTEGLVGLQAKGTGEIRFRNIKIKSLR